MYDTMHILGMILNERYHSKPRYKFYNANELHFRVKARNVVRIENERLSKATTERLTKPIR